jgi:hypothetical protein
VPLAPNGYVWALSWRLTEPTQLAVLLVLVAPPLLQKIPL